MQLRRLELVGFKTFVDRTELEFHPGITAIVGPNGSGKSNIFDAIRWALGETNSRLLRGARMEDVIFSGSATRRATGIASVSLTLDNGAGLLPLDFSEITVGRTVTRGGDGEYAVNGVDCRLRDIQMLFLGTGLGGRSYALIGQGEVDAVLRATPVERRHWLEEAAGLARHKRQRVEAERRLDHAQTHLDRLTDLLDELAHQQVALAAQAEAAARHQALTGEARDLELALFADEVRRLLGSFRRLTAQLVADREQAAAAEARVAEASADVAMGEAQVASVTAAFENGQHALLTGAETLSARAGDAQALEAQAEGLRGRMTRLNVEIARILEEHASLTGDTERLGQEAANTEHRRSMLVGDLDTADAALRQAAAAAGEAETQLRGYREETVEVARALAQSRSDLAGMRARAEVLTQAVEATAEKAGALNEEAARLGADRQRVRLACEASRAAVGVADNALAAAARVVEGCRRDAAAATDAGHAAELYEHGLQARLASIEEAAAQFLGFEESAREVLLAARADPALFPGLRGAVADLLEVPEAHRQAVGAALGERLHCLVTGTRASLMAVVEFFRGHASRHGTVLALDAVRPRSPVDLAPCNGDVTIRATDVVGVDMALRPVVETLLADVVIVTDLDAAWRLHETGFEGRIVTSDGTILSPDGVATVGGHPQGEAAVLGRNQTIAELRAGVESATARREQAVQRRLEAARHLAAAEEAQLAAQADRVAAAAVLADRQQQAARLEADITRVSDEEVAHAAQARTSAESLKHLQEEIAALEIDVASLEGEASRFEALVAHAQLETARLGTARNAASDQVAGLRLALAQIDGALEAVRGRLSDRRTLLGDIEARRTDLVDTAGRTAAELAGIVRRRDEAMAAHERLLAVQAETKVEVERLAAERVRLREELSARQAAHVAALDAAHAAGAELHRTEVRAAQAEAELGASAGRLREQYGIALEDAAARRLEGSREEARARLEALQAAIRDLGPVNLRAIDEHAGVTARLDELRDHTEDIAGARDHLREAIVHINAALRVRFRQTFDDVSREFGRLFDRLFEGGQGALELVEDDLGAEPGLEVIAQLPGKRRRPLVALSGGERALVALTLIFAMLRVHPSPFCIFDEVEAALDDANTRKFTELLRDLAEQTQVLIITHNKGTMTAADILYGVTMQEPGISSIVSVRLVAAPENGDRRHESAEGRVDGPAGETKTAVREAAGHRRETVALPAE